MVEEMSHNCKGRDAWLDDEEALADYFLGSPCGECGREEDDCDCEKPTEEKDDDE